jgi:hypothetical protein
MRPQAAPPQQRTRPNMPAVLAEVPTTTAVAAAPPKGGKPTDEQVAAWLRGYAERGDPATASGSSSPTWTWPTGSPSATATAPIPPPMTCARPPGWG